MEEVSQWSHQSARTGRVRAPRLFREAVIAKSPIRTKFEKEARGYRMMVCMNKDKSHKIITASQLLESLRLDQPVPSAETSDIVVNFVSETLATMIRCAEASWQFRVCNDERDDKCKNRLKRKKALFLRTLANVLVQISNEGIGYELEESVWLPCRDSSPDTCWITRMKRMQDKAKQVFLNPQVTFPEVPTIDCLQPYS
ncbi:hypothetical protein NliqN6_1678 [Naganishia liquefaciens]|uniref:Uncharacterized protein n=1 Tax=Naganishia liquefaciens TaxID=104408 RepID=A0A8H3TQ19_9TREE|nr:hypothetical protein NliqN6_1678 [Naganishia liquefaciens]